jgi:catechol 2,3-dioxygenase-like lactoylglutathione lyase family enzyme
MKSCMPVQTCRLTRFELVARQAHVLAQFYREAFSARYETSGHLDGYASESLLGVAGQTRYLTIRLGAEAIDFLEFEQLGRKFPSSVAVTDLLFQHFAIVVSEMGLALERLCATSGWTAITHGGPQRLPESSGGVTAFKFRDPAGHPLELLEFPEGKIPQKWRDRRGALFLGIDHSAITVRDTATSERFYAGLGFLPSGQSINRGPEQERLDGLPGAVVEVTALSSADDAPHIELLCYRGASRDDPAGCDNNDTAATRLGLECEELSAREGLKGQLLDPDGHRVILLNHAFPRRDP